MQQSGYEVRVARTGREALEAIATFAPDIVLLDVMMSERNGYEVCQAIRANPAWQHVKIVMLSAKGRDIEVAKGLDVGADAYITKPFSTRDLVARVRGILGD
jgi:DNA-binding response OmpR family regulator